MRTFLAAMDWIDVVFLAGLALAAWGGWQLSPPITAIVVGVVVMGVCLLQRRPK